MKIPAVFIGIPSTPKQDTVAGTSPGGSSVIIRDEARIRAKLAVMAEAVVAVNEMAHLFDHKRCNKRRTYEAKNQLASIMIEMQEPSVSVRWRFSVCGNPLILLSIADFCCVHVPFDRLSPLAQSIVVQQIGPEPDPVFRHSCVPADNGENL